MALKVALKVAPKIPKLILKVILNDTQMILKNKLLTSSTIPYLPKTKLGSLLITSKLPLVYERRILVLLLKSYIQYILCIYVYMYSRIHEYTFKPISAKQRL